MRFQIIASFEKLDQDIIDIDLPETYYENETRFLTTVFNCMDENSIKELVKFSVCQHVKSHSDAIQWLIDRNGKYYFNYGVNNDEDTKNLHEFKNFYLETKKRIQEQESKKLQERQ
jgi:hypothetical protein